MNKSIDLNKELDEERIIVILITLNNYLNRIDYLKRNNRISDYKLKGLQNNLDNINYLIYLFSNKLEVNINGRRNTRY